MSYKQARTIVVTKSRGLGDTIDKMTSATGIKPLVKKMAKTIGIDDCCCEERRDTLNRLFPYK